jgi:hypothetical protein
MTSSKDPHAPPSGQDQGVSPSEPYRYDDRSGHYGSGQADLAPVSGDPAPVTTPDEVARDPMGASAGDSGWQEATEAPAGQSPPAAARSDDAQPENNEGQAASSVAASPPAAAAPDAAEQAEPREVESETTTMAAETDQTVHLHGHDWDGDGATRETTVNADAQAQIEVADTIQSMESSGDAGGSPIAAGPAAAFADMARQMDQMMAEMTSRMGSRMPENDASDDDDDDLPLLDGLGEAPIFGALEEAQNQLDDRVSELWGSSAADDGPITSAPILAALFEGGPEDSVAGGLDVLEELDPDQLFGDPFEAMGDLPAIGEPFEALGDDVPGVAGGLTGPPAWDDLPDLL